MSAARLESSNSPDGKPTSQATVAEVNDRRGGGLGGGETVCLMLATEGGEGTFAASSSPETAKQKPARNSAAASLFVEPFKLQLLGSCGMRMMMWASEVGEVVKWLVDLDSTRPSVSLPHPSRHKQFSVLHPCWTHTQ